VYGVFRTTLAVATLELGAAQLGEERARKYALEAQLASLESHIRPHFLFNTLNTISSLIQDDPKLANPCSESWLPCSDSRLFQSTESFAAGTRDEDCEALPGNRKGAVRRPPCVMRSQYRQRWNRRRCPRFASTLVENSVKHAVANRIEGGAIRIAARAGGGEICLEVYDDGPGFTTDASGPDTPP